MNRLKLSIIIVVLLPAVGFATNHQGYGEVTIPETVEPVVAAPVVAEEARPKRVPKAKAARPVAVPPPAAAAPQLSFFDL